MSQEMDTHTVAVVIVGAGPTGLLLANILQVHGVSFVLVEQRRSHEPQDSRCTTIQTRVIEVMQQLGLDTNALAAHSNIYNLVSRSVHQGRSQVYSKFGGDQVWNKSFLGTQSNRGTACLSIPQHEVCLW